MSKSQTLRALVNERLAAAAEEIFVLVERTIVEYEEELCRSKEENQRKQELLDKVLYPKIVLVRGNVQIPKSPGSELNQEITETPRIKEEPVEQSVKQEEEQLPVPVPESSAVCVKTEESSLLQQRQTEHREETQGEDISSETHEGHTEHWSDTDNDDDGERLGTFSCSTAQMETEADGDQVQIRDRSTKLSPQSKSAPETTAHTAHTVHTDHTGHTSGADGAAKTKPQCPFCQKRFSSKEKLEIHIRVHTGERPYRCPVCEKTFTDLSTFNRHNKVVHAGERTFTCPVCNKNFAHKYTLEYHKRIHTGEKPYCCAACDKTFADHSTFRRHLRTHTGEQPFRCEICKKTCARKDNLQTHMKIHFDV